MLVIGLPYKL